MEFLIVRHGIAEDMSLMGAKGKGDFDRALTAEGRTQMEKAARGLIKIIKKPEVIYASPLVRAQQTALILAATFGVENIDTEDGLCSEVSPEETFRRLASLAAEYNQVVCVGHQPNIGNLISYMIAGTFASPIDMGRGAACLVRFQNSILPGRGTVRFHTPRWIW